MSLGDVWKARDADGDGFVHDGTPRQRPVGPGDSVGRNAGPSMGGGVSRQNRRSKRKYTGNQWTQKLAAELLRDGVVEGGATRVPRSGSRGGKVTSGIVVSEHEERSFHKRASDITLRDIVQWLVANGDLFEEGKYAGVWLESGEVWLDPVSVYPQSQRRDAIAAGRDHNQIAAWDLDNMEEIRLGGTGEVMKSGRVLVGIFRPDRPREIMEAIQNAALSKARKRDADGDGFVNDGTPAQRPASPAEMAPRTGGGRPGQIGGVPARFTGAKRPKRRRQSRTRKPSRTESAKRTAEREARDQSDTRRDASDRRSEKRQRQKAAQEAVSGAASQKVVSTKPDAPKQGSRLNQRLDSLKEQPKPVRVRSAKKALEMIAKGERVELDPKTLAAMLDKLAKIGEDAYEREQRGETVNLPDYDLCRVYVPDTNIFCADNLGIVRDKMPQLSGKRLRPGSVAAKKLDKVNAKRKKDGKEPTDEVDFADEFMAMLAKKGVKITDEKVDARTLRATQSQLKGGQIGGMMEASTVKGGKLDLSKPIFISSDGYILDGHHRWAALTSLTYTEQKSLQMNVRRIDLPIADLVDVTNEFTQLVGILPKKGGGGSAVSKRRRGRERSTRPSPKSTPKEIVGSHGHKPHGPSILWPALYEHLRAKGMTKAKAAAISNAGWKKKRMGIPTNTPMSARGLLKSEPPCIGCGDEIEKIKLPMGRDTGEQRGGVIRTMRRGAYRGHGMPGSRRLGRPLTPAEIQQRRNAGRSKKEKGIEAGRRRLKSLSIKAQRQQRREETRALARQRKAARRKLKEQRRGTLREAGRSAGKALETMVGEAIGVGPAMHYEMPPLHPEVQRQRRMEKSAISKLDDEKQMVFGWAYVSHDGDGELVVDKSGDFIEDVNELEDAAYEFVLHSRQGGVNHARTDDGPVVKSSMVESMVVTPEKLDAMGIDSDGVPTGWWVGFRVDDPAVWQEVKAGRYQAFSIHGSGVRRPVHD